MGYHVVHAHDDGSIRKWHDPIDEPIHVVKVEEVEFWIRPIPAPSAFARPVRPGTRRDPTDRADVTEDLGQVADDRDAACRALGGCRLAVDHLRDDRVTRMERAVSKLELFLTSEWPVPVDAHELNSRMGN